MIASSVLLLSMAVRLASSVCKVKQPADSVKASVSENTPLGIKIEGTTETSAPAAATVAAATVAEEPKAVAVEEQQVFQAKAAVEEVPEAAAVDETAKQPAGGAPEPPKPPKREPEEGNKKESFLGAPSSWWAKSTSATEGWVGGEEDLKGGMGESSPAEAAAQELASKAAAQEKVAVASNIPEAAEAPKEVKPDVFGPYGAWLVKTTSTTEGWVGGEEDLKGAAGQPSPAEVAQQAKEAEAAKAAKKAKKAKAKPPVLSLEESQARGAELLKVLAEAENGARTVATSAGPSAAAQAAAKADEDDARRAVVAIGATALVGIPIAEAYYGINTKLQLQVPAAVKPAAATAPATPVAADQVAPPVAAEATPVAAPVAASDEVAPPVAVEATPVAAPVVASDEVTPPVAVEAAPGAETL
jgi:hypothetical protein